MKKNKFAPFCIKNIFWRLRHNIIFYLLWDAPITIGEERGDAKYLVKLSIRLCLLGGGLFAANLSYYQTLSPPKFSDLQFTKGKLERVIRSAGKGSALRIIVVDKYSNKYVFPTIKRSLSQITLNQATELQKNCVGKDIEVHWYAEPLLFLGTVKDVWALETCIENIKIDYKRKVEQRIRYKESNTKIVVTSLSVSLLSFITFLFNFKKANTILRQKKNSRLKKYGDY